MFTIIISFNLIIFISCSTHLKRTVLKLILNRTWRWSRSTKPLSQTRSP